MSEKKVPPSQVPLDPIGQRAATDFGRLSRLGRISIGPIVASAVIGLLAPIHTVWLIASGSTRSGSTAVATTWRVIRTDASGLLLASLIATLICFPLMAGGEAVLRALNLRGPSASIFLVAAFAGVAVMAFTVFLSSMPPSGPQLVAVIGPFFVIGGLAGIVLWALRQTIPPVGSTDQ